MDADLQGFLDYYRRRKADGLFQTNSGYTLSDKEAKAYARWGIKNGYKLLKEMPEFEEVKDKLNIKL